MASNANADVDKLITFGQMALEQGWYDQARGCFQQALALDLSNREATDGLARIDAILHRKEAAAIEPKQDEPVERPSQAAIREGTQVTQADLRRLELSQELSETRLQLSILQTEARALERQREQQGRKGLAIASMVFGIVSLFAWLLPICGLPIGSTGVILGVLGLNSSRRGMAIAGIIMCGIGLIGTIINGLLAVYFL